jgi:serine protease Do
MHELPRIVANMPPGNVAEVRLLRSGKEQMVQVKVGEMVEEQRQAVVGGSTPGEGGLAAQDLTPEVARSLGLSDTQGVIVTDVEEGSPADQVGMRRGDVILEVYQQKITNLQDYRAPLGRTEETKSLLFLVRRGDNTVYVALRPEE